VKEQLQRILFGSVKPRPQPIPFQRPVKLHEAADAVYICWYLLMLLPGYRLFVVPPLFPVGIPGLSGTTKHAAGHTALGDGTQDRAAGPWEPMVTGYRLELLEMDLLKLMEFMGTCHLLMQHVRWMAS
jgi:hypothetical protein